ncbi:MAG: NADH:flavin oxidoreductase [Chloroflexota bacterium]
MAELFERTLLNGMELRNRFVHSATNEGSAKPDDGTATDRLVRIQEELAEGEVALIVPGNMYVNVPGKSRPCQTGIHDDSTIPGLTRMTGAVHRHGACIVAQLAHAGANAYVPTGGDYALGPSDMKLTDIPSRAMNRDQIRQTTMDFAAAAIRARKAGFDGVQLHGAHSYLLSQFVSPYFNKRTDEYGGSLENWARFPLEVVRAVRDAVGSDYPVLIKINSEDFLEGGFPLSEMVPYCLMLEGEGIDAIEISGGTHFSDPRYFCSRPVGTVPKEQEIYFKQAAELYKDSVTVPLILVGGVRSLRVADQVVRTGLADYVALCRPLIREPGLIKRWREGDVRDATCISCNLCFGPVRAGEGLYCVALERQQKRST